MNVDKNGLKRDGCTLPVSSGKALVCLIPWVMLVLIGSILVGGLPSTGYGDKDPLTAEERAWLKQHDGKIIVNNEAGWPPIIDRDKAGNSFGIVMDYQRLIEKKLGFTFKMDRPDSWTNFMERFRRREIDVNNNLQENPKRAEYALFTKPYIEIPNVIIVRKEDKRTLTLEKMGKMTIAVTDDFAIHDYIRSHYDTLQIKPLDDDMICLLETSTKNVDAAVVNLAVASYIIEKMGISNLRVAGYAGYTNALSFASRKDWPILNRILVKGLDLITQAESDVIYRKWISLGYQPFYKSSLFWIIVCVAGAVIIAIFLMVLVWNRSLKRQIELRTRKLETVNVQLKKEIDERLQAEEELKKSERKWRNILVNTPQIGIALDTRAGIVFANDHFLKLTGWTRQEVMGQDWFDMFIPETIREEIRQVFLTTMDQKQTQGFSTNENEIVTRSGELRNIAWSNVLTLDAQGNVLDVTCLGIDLTERRRAEEELMKSEANYRLLVENQTDLVVKVDLEGRFLFVSPSYCRMFGKTEIELMGKKFMPMVHEEDREPTQKAMETLFLPPYTAYLEQRAMTKDGWLWLAWADTAVLDSSGNVKEIIGVGRDITEKKRAEKDHEKLEGQLRQAQKMESVGRLAGGVAHDFNNMLGIILGNTEMILDDIGPENPIRESLQEIYKAAERSTNLTRQLLAFARKQTIAPKVLDLNKTLGAMLTMLQRLIGEDIDLAWLPKTDLWPVKIDPSQVDQILANLCVNARDAINGVGKITIETDNVAFDEEYCRDHLGFDPGNYVMIAVSDSGVGMNKEILENLFEPFFTTKDVGQGSGLGLATVYGIVKQNRGFINVYSETDSGTTFKIYLPRLMETVIERQKTDSDRPAATGSETILLVEDEVAILTMTSVMLQRLGYTVLEASTPGRAIRIAESKSSKIHLLMTDVVMPRMSGRDLAVKLMALNPNLKCLFMSGYTANVIAHHGVLDEGVQFIHKPFLMQDLATKVREVLDGEKAVS